MASAHSSNPRQPSKMKPPTATTSPTKDQSASNPRMSKHQITDTPSSTDSTPITAISKDDRKVSPTSSHKSVSPIKTPPSPTANTRSRSHSPVPATSTEEEVNISNKDPCETEEVKIIPSEEKKEPERCAICLDDYTEPKELDKCGHTFCTDCIDYYFRNVKPQCPCCFTIYGELRGNQPEDGTMTHTVLKDRLPGFGRTSTGTIQITYTFPNGIQGENHPNPGTRYYGTRRHAYLPDNEDGWHVFELLKRAFDLRQTFTVGQSRTSGRDNVVTWNDIHHKTNIAGGMENFGYPDRTYLNRVQQELAAKGIQ